MKKMTLLVMMSVIFQFFMQLQAQTINQQTAKIVALSFLNQNHENQTLLSDTSDLKLILNYKGDIGENEEINSENVLIYLFSNEDRNRFVFVSGDDRVIPILGYSNSNVLDPENIPPALQKWIENYKSQILYVKEQNLQASSEIIDEWTNLLTNRVIENRSATSVNPLLTTTWNQGQYYNAMCPEDYGGPAGHCYTGCVATAMAQIMKYWNYPIQGTGFHSYNHPDYGTLTANFAATTYNWATMPNNVNSTNNSVATLMYHCGVSVDMDYGINGSSANTSDVVYALENYFQYSTSSEFVQKSNYSNSEWIQMLKDELDAGRPMQYRGSGSEGGHSFVCDGYDNYSNFHFNWGWGGSANGYFALTNLNPGTYEFTSNQAAIIGIQPASGGGSANIDLYTSITITPDPIEFYQSIDVYTDVINSGSANFSGDYCAALFDEDGTFIDFISILTTGSNPLPPGYHYSGGLTFSNDGIVAVPGIYIIGVYFREADGEWQLAGNATYSNPINTSINCPNNSLEQYSEIVVTPSTLVQGQSATVNVNFYNTNSYTYYGQYQAALYDLEGNFVQTLGIYNETSGLPAGYTYAEPYINFNCNNITASPGTYMLAIIEKESGYSSWYFVGGSYYLTPITIDVIEAPPVADQYEPNNSQSAAFLLPKNWSNNIAHCYTYGSNSHTGDDYDFYRINLSSGYNYTITARVHDSYNSGNGNTYTNDVAWAYNKGNGWSEFFDDVMPGNIQINGTGNIYFQVLPYFIGTTGTYLMDIQIHRTSNVEIKEEGIGDIDVFPNPAKNKVFVRLAEQVYASNHWQLTNQLGQEVLNGELTGVLTEIDISKCYPGIYILRINVNDKIYLHKIVHH